MLVQCVIASHAKVWTCQFWLAGTPKDKNYISLSSKLEIKGLMKPETASSTRSTLHLSRLNISFQCIEALFQ